MTTTNLVIGGFSLIIGMMLGRLSAGTKSDPGSEARIAAARAAINGDFEAYLLKLLGSGERVEAIRVVREATGLQLMESRMLVEMIERETRGIVA